MSCMMVSPKICEFSVHAWSTGAGNQNPPIRKPFPDISITSVEEHLDTYVRKIGTKEAFNLYSYRTLQAQQAESPQSLHKLAGLLDALVSASPSAEIKHTTLKQALQTLVHRFGVEMLAAHNTDTSDKGLLPGKVADCIGVLLKHWRKVTKNPKNWEALCGRLEGVKAAQLSKTYKKMSQPFEGGQKTTTRTLKVELSEVSVDSLGLAKVASASESDDSHENDSMSETDRAAACSAPPPVGKKDWRNGAIKRPACSSELAKSETSSKSYKKPSASPEVASGGSKTPSTEGHGGPIVETLSIGGGKVQSYIQHRPGFCKSKKLIVAITSGQAERTSKSHKDLIQLLVSACKKPGATKESVLEHRARLLKQHALHKG